MTIRKMAKRSEAKRWEAGQSSCHTQVHSRIPNFRHIESHFFAPDFFALFVIGDGRTAFNSVVFIRAYPRNPRFFVVTAQIDILRGAQRNRRVYST
jgi:hypothetical protein